MNNSNKYLKWLESQMDIWVGKNVISHDQRLLIENIYDDISYEKKDTLPVVLAVIGSALVGLGIILLLARNWSEFSRPLRLALSVLPFTLGVVVAFLVILKEKEKWMNEAVGVFIPISLVAGLGLIGQTYHSVAPGQSIFLICALLSLPFVYILNSSIAAMVYIFLSAIFVTASPVEYMYFSLLKATAMIALIFPYCILIQEQKRKFESSWVNLFAAFYGFVSIIATTNQSSYFMENLLVYGLIIIALFALKSERYSFCYSSGMLLVFIIFFISTFQFRWRYDFSGNFDTESFLIIQALSLVSMLLFYVNLKNKNINVIKYAAFLLIPYISIIYSSLKYSVALENTVVWGFNLVFFAVAIAIFVTGSKLLLRSDASIARANIGLVLILAIISKWFFDIDISFLGRGILFILLGITFLTFNFVFNKKKRGIVNVK